MLQNLLISNHERYAYTVVEHDFNFSVMIGDPDIPSSKFSFFFYPILLLAQNSNTFWGTNFKTETLSTSSVSNLTSISYLGT